MPQSVAKQVGRYPVVVINPVPDNFASGSVDLAVVSKDDPLLQSKSNTATTKKQVALSGTGSLSGKIINTQSQPVAGVTIKIKNLTAQTNAQGSFRLDNIPAGKHVLLMDGSTAQDKDGRYPTIPLTVDIKSGVVNEMPFQPFIHRQKNRNFKSIEHNKMSMLSGPEAPRMRSNGDVVVTDPELPGVELTIPKGVNITGWDGKPNKKVSMRTVPIDRLPVKPMPDNAYARTVHMFYFDKVGGGVPDKPIPFKTYNDLGLLPGSKAILWYYDESPNEGEAPNDWAIAGTGTVTPDGKFIVSDLGSGIPKFCCGAASYGGSGAGSGASGPGGASDGPGNGPPCNDPCGCNNGAGGGGDAGSGGPSPSEPSPEAGDPIDVVTGYFQYKKTDYLVPGIIPAKLIRYYRSGDNGLGYFGKGTYFEYDWWVGQTGDMLLLLIPGNYQISFSKQVDGTFINSGNPTFKGDVITKKADNTFVMKKANGWVYEFGAYGLLMTIRDPSGNVLAFERKSYGDISKITTPEGKIITIDMVNYNVTKITGPYGAVSYNYGGGQLVSVAYPDGSSVNYEYDASGNMSKITENGNLVVQNVYDTGNRVIKQTHADGGVFTYSYTLAAGFVTQTSMTSPNNAVSTWRFNSSKYITDVITPDGTTTYEREAATNRILSITDPLARKKIYTYDTKGRVKTFTDSSGHTTAYEYEDTFNKLTKTTDALGNVTSYSYDSNGNLVTFTTPDNKTTSYTYNSQGKPLTITDPLSHQSRMVYDSAGKLVNLIDAAGHTTFVEYDELDRVSKITDAKGLSSQYQYDTRSRITVITDSNGNKSVFSYDINGNMKEIRDAKGHTVKYDYDNRNRVTQTTDARGKTTAFIYDTSDNLVSATDRNGRITQFEYDLMTRLKKVTYNDASTIAYQYDAAGRVLSGVDSASGTIAYTYADGGCSGCSISSGDRLAQVTAPLGSISYTYDEIGRRQTTTVQGQPAINYVYDKNRLTGLNVTVSSLGKLNFIITYDGDGRRDTLQMPNGITTKYDYDTVGNVNTLTHKNATSATIESVNYTYDTTGNRISMTRPNVTILLPKPVTSATYDEANRQLTLQPTSGTTKNITYDDNGNMTAITDVCGTSTYTWNVRNQLTGIAGYKPDCTALTASFKYDAIGRRIEKTINGKTTNYLYDGANIVQELEGGSVTANYVGTGYIDELLARIKTDGTIRYYQRDGLGSVIALTDNTGAVKTQYAYDPFGNTTATGEASDNPFQYTGRENDGTGLYYYRARYYNPELQRFISEDPIGLAGGNVNFYGYVQNNPVNWLDPSGLATIIPINPYDGCPKGSNCPDPGPMGLPPEDPEFFLPGKSLPESRIPPNALPPPDWPEKLCKLFQPPKIKPEKKPRFKNYH